MDGLSLDEFLQALQAPTYGRIRGCDAVITEPRPPFDQDVELVLVLWEPMEPKHRDVTSIGKRGNQFEIQSYNLPSTTLLEARIRFLARQALVEMARFAVKQKDDSTPTCDVVERTRDTFSGQPLKIRVRLGSVHGGKNVDIDNCLKLVSDALVPVLYDDDRLVSEMTVQRIEEHHLAESISKEGVVPTIVVVSRTDPSGHRKKSAAGVYAFPLGNAHFRSNQAPVLNAV